MEQGETDEIFYKDNTCKLYIDYKLYISYLVDSQFCSSHILHSYGNVIVIFE